PKTSRSSFTAIMAGAACARGSGCAPTAFRRPPTLQAESTHGRASSIKPWRVTIALYGIGSLERAMLLPVAMRFILLAIALILFSFPASAMTLQQTLIDAYNFNPDLKAERARLRTTDEGVALAKSGQRPSIVGDAEVGHSETNTLGQNFATDPRG